MRRAILIIFLLVVGCSDSTIRLPTIGADEQVGGRVLQIALPNGNRADCASVDDCTLVKAAEATQRVGGTHFILLPGHDGPTQRGFAYIKVFTFNVGERVPSTAMSVEEALYFFRRPHWQVG